jgi:RimJ/RimL family protein N-acetyltransferase
MRVQQAPSVEGNDISLRQIEHSDVYAWYAYLSESRVVEHTSWNVRSPGQLAGLLDSYMSSDPDSQIRFAIVAAPAPELVGTIGFHTRSAKNRTAEIAFDLKPSLWGQGIMPRCVRSVVEWGFSVLGLVRMQATALNTNAASVRVLEKCGFVREGLLRNYRFVRGEPRDFWMYSVVVPAHARGNPDALR